MERKKILIVEDELMVSRFIHETLTMIGYETKTLYSGKDVIQTVKEWIPDLVTLDIMMPPPDGIQVLADLKRDPETQNVPVFIVSCCAGNVDMNSISKADGIFEKPLEVKPFVEAIRKAVSRNVLNETS